ncbi:MAG: hypothetical protein Tsb006_7730 [Rickettsiaceae bacterium]
MGVEVALIIAISASVISLISAGTSIGTFFYSYRKFKAGSKDSTHVDIENTVIDRTEANGTREHQKKQKIHIENIDTEFVSDTMSTTRTGLPNKTAETLAGNATGALTGLLPNPVSSGAIGAIAGIRGNGNSEASEIEEIRVDPQPAIIELTNQDEAELSHHYAGPDHHHSDISDIAEASASMIVKEVAHIIGDMADTDTGECSGNGCDVELGCMGASVDNVVAAG